MPSAAPRLMRVGVQTWGTEGDVRPFFSLAHALARRGHDVEVLYTNVESRDFSALARSCGIRATAVGAEHFEKNREHLAARARMSFEIGDPMKQVDLIMEDLLDPVAEPMFEAGRALAARSDVMVGHFLAHPAHAAAEAHRRPLITVALVPVLPSRTYAPIGMPSLGRWLHPLEWWISKWVVERVFAKRANALRARFGLPAIRDMLDAKLTRSRLGLTGVSPTLFPRPDDWSERAHVCGSLSLPERAEPWDPDPALKAFLDAGPPPAFLSFGSMFNLDLERTARVVEVLAEAVERAGQRGIVQAPAEVIANARPRASVHFLARTPHVHLFPRCLVIVHHGGAGTTQSALLAGRPSIVVPHAADQFYWGDVLARQGAGTAPIRSTKLTAEALAARLSEAARRPELATKAAALGQAIAAERGPERAAELIERYASPG